MPLKFISNAAMRRDTVRIVYGGVGGAGKSTAAALVAKKALYFDLDHRFPKNEELKGKTNFAELEQESLKGVKAYLNDILNEPKIDNDWIVIDTGTKLLAYMEDHITVMEYEGKAEKYHAYGSGTKHLPKHIREVTDLLEKIEAKHKVNIAIICHTGFKPTKNPMGEDYMKNSLDLPTLDATNRLKQWADAVGFIYFEVDVDKEKHKAKGPAKRIITFSESPLHDAKNGLPWALPDKIPFDIEGKWAELVFNGSYAENREMVKQIDALIESYPAGQRSEIRSRFETIGYRTRPSKDLKPYLEAAKQAKGGTK